MHLEHIIVVVATISLFENTECRPQDVQIEKQLIIELPSRTKYIQESSIESETAGSDSLSNNTKEILSKIQELNKEVVKKNGDKKYTEVNDLNSIPERDSDDASKVNDIRKDNIPNGKGIISTFGRSFPNTFYDYLNNQPNGIIVPNIEINTNSIDSTPNRKAVYQFPYLVPNLLGYNPSYIDPRQPALSTASSTVLPALAGGQFNMQPTFNQFYKPNIYPTNIYPQPIMGVNDMKDSILNNFNTRNGSPTKQIQWQWPLAQYFPIIIKDPFLSLYNGGTGLIEYGPTADVCSKAQGEISDTKKIETIKRAFNAIGRTGKSLQVAPASIESPVHKAKPANTASPVYLKVEAIKQENRKVEKDTRKAQNEEASYAHASLGEDLRLNVKPVVKTTTTKVSSDKTEDEVDGELRFPFDSPFGWFGQKKPVAPSPGFFINRLRVRKGGVAIAGPGGIASAGSGATAIIGPGGTAYTQPGGLAIAGPSAKIIALPADVDLNEFMAYLGNNQKPKDVNETTYDDQPSSRSLHRSKSSKRRKNKVVLPKGSRLVATGPVVYFHPTEATQTETFLLPFYGGAKGQVLEIVKDAQGVIISEKVISDVTQIQNEKITEDQKDNATNVIESLHNIRISAQKLIDIQEAAKKIGKLERDAIEKYNMELALLRQSASKLAYISEKNGQEIVTLVEQSTKKPSHKYDEDDVGEEGDDTEDNVTVERPGESTSVAEAKPVGLAIAGPGGVASSKPVATAVVGASGLAVARPVATAIAGVDPHAVSIPQKKQSQYIERFKRFFNLL